MVKYKVEIPGVPRKEIDRLENALDKLLYRKEGDRFECSWKESYTDGKKGGPEAHIWTQYRLSKKSQPVINIDAQGITKEGDFKIELDINVSDQAYSRIEQMIQQEVPYIGKFLRNLKNLVI